MLALRKFLVTLLLTLHRSLVFMLISIIALLWQFGDRNYLLDTLDSVNFDETLVPAIIASNATQSFTDDGSLPLGNPEVAAIFSQAFPPETVRSATRSVVDPLYDYLEGKNETLSVTIDITDNERLLRQNIADYAVNRLADLPECTDLSTPINPLTTDCQPPNLNTEAERMVIANTIDASDPVIEDTVLDSEDILPDNLPIDLLPQAAIWLKRLPYGISVTLIALAVIIMRLSSTRRRGLRRVIKTYLSVSLTLVALAVIFGFLLPQLVSSNPLFQTGGNDLSSLINTIVNQISRDYLWRVFILSMPVLIIGLLLLLKTGKSSDTASTNLNTNRYS